MSRLRNLARKWSSAGNCKLTHNAIRAKNFSSRLLVTACAVTLIGCSAMKLRMGWRVDLTQAPVASIEVSLPEGPIAPGKKSPLVVKVTQPDGKVLFTEGQGHGKVQWKDLAVKAEIVSLNNKGVLSLSKDPRLTDGKMGQRNRNCAKPSGCSCRGAGRSVSI